MSIYKRDAMLVFRMQHVVNELDFITNNLALEDYQQCAITHAAIIIRDDLSANLSALLPLPTRLASSRMGRGFGNE
ncbi:MAG: hypothetical protein EAZ24_08250 [Burkholderiales bacterium]|nr:MAG: hypothetical protein EAZ24_08250 [Burkholderiales bacterium]